MFKALAIARWQILMNSLRRDRSKRYDLAAKFLAGLLIFLAFLGVGSGMGAIGYFSSLHGNGVAVVFWLIFGLWFFLQVGGATAGNPNLRDLSRYPIPFRLFCMLQASYAVLDPVVLAAAFWMLCALTGFAFGRPSLAQRALPMMAGLWLVTLLLTRMISELVERVTSTKKGRRRLMTGFIALSLGYQYFALGNRLSGGVIAVLSRALGPLAPFLPPAIAARGAQGGNLAAAAAGLAAYLFVLSPPLLWIFQRKFQGGLFSEAPAAHGKAQYAPGWQLPLVSNTVSALVEKEFRYMLSQPLGWLNFGYGPLLALLMSLGMARNFHLGRDSMFPFVVGWIMLMVGARAYNAFGFDVVGFNRYLLTPVEMRRIIGSKNLAVALLLICNFMGIAAVLASVAPFSSLLFLNVLGGFLFALLANLSAGNFLSVRFPMGVDLETMRSKNASTMGQLGNFGTQFLIAGTLGAVFYWKLPAIAIFTALASVSGALYWTSLDSAARYAECHGEEIAQSLAG